MTRTDLSGPIEATSPWGSPEWAFQAAGAPVATARRRRRRPSRVTLADGTEWWIAHDGWDDIVVYDAADTRIAHAHRKDVLGRTWDLDVGRTSFELACESMLRRRWTLGPPGAPFASVHGGMVSFNSMRIETGLSIPIGSALLAWQIIVRSWEAAAASRAG